MDKLNTYEELASYIITLWETSKEHRRAQRDYTYDTLSYKKYNEKIYGIFSCKVMYDKNSGVTKAVLNMVN
jgi:HJR/Mrr/RecB family endonuclease